MHPPPPFLGESRVESTNILNNSEQIEMVDSV